MAHPLLPGFGPAEQQGTYIMLYEHFFFQIPNVPMNHSLYPKLQFVSFFYQV
jgi:hypothetical protein